MYTMAAELGDKRAAERLSGNAGPVATNSVVQRDGDGMGSGETPRTKDKDCVIM